LWCVIIVAPWLPWRLGAVVLAEGRCLSLGGGEGLWVAGPARVRVEEGEVLASGYVLAAGGEAVVRAARGFTFYALGRGARVCISGGSGSGARLVGDEGFGVVEEWLRLVERLRGEGARRVVVMGPPESGKSTLAAFLSNMLEVGVLEADVGQNELGLPACVSYAPRHSRILVLEDLAGDASCIFVGHVSAERVMDAIVSAAVAAAARLEGGFVADTDGFVEARGAVYKAWLAEALAPDAVVLVGQARSLMEALRAHGLRVYTAPPAPRPRWRSREDRRAFRSRHWSRLFAAAARVTLHGVPVEPLCPYTTAGDAVVYTCPGGEAIVESRRRPEVPGRWLRPGWARGLVAGLRLRGGADVPALVEALDLASGKLVARSPRPVEPGSVVGAHLGWVRLGENMVEEHLRVEPYPLPLLAPRPRRPKGHRG
jgi:polynucleotide 5'-hydroxyl-kinase GRC3/NOL9